MVQGENVCEYNVVEQWLNRDVDAPTPSPGIPKTSERMSFFPSSSRNPVALAVQRVPGRPPPPLAAVPFFVTIHLHARLIPRIRMQPGSKPIPLYLRDIRAIHVGFGHRPILTLFGLGHRRRGRDR